MRSSTILTTATTLLKLTHAQSSSPKRGLCHVPSPDHPSDDSIWTTGPSPPTWYYNYNSTPSESYTSSSMTFVPMLWGASASDTGTPFLDSVKAQLASGANITHVLGFNEPDGPHDTGGSNLAPSLAASRWKAEIEPLKDLGIQLGAPGVTGAASGWEWLDAWFAACDGGCTPDFIPVHWYGNFEGMMSHVGRVTAKWPNMTVWVTEFGFPDEDLEVSKEFWNMSASAFDGWEYVFPPLLLFLDLGLGKCLGCFANRGQ